ncbi:MAG: hypothetical protein A2V70_17570 [Planctomycetes bacterium RBG_13_63_9]|nr:MAG: hypothetical protein A2V70_17570 [Planctomycetes bacterium RBG_13_63_9]
MGIACLWSRIRVSLLGGAFALGVFAACKTGLGDVLGDLTRPIPGRPQRASSGEFDPESNRDSHHPQPGQRLVIADLDGPGEIRHMWFTIASLDRRYPRTLVLRIYYDHSTVPSVESPIGDFFAAGNGMRANVSTTPIEVSSYGRALNSYWRMPFKKHCRIEVHNQGTETMCVYFQGDWLKLDSLPDDVCYFHARYRQEYPAKPFSWYTVFEGKGEGHYVGTVFSSQNNVRSWFGEADDRFYVDGEEIPSLIGTGTEDYFNDAWNLRLTSNKRVGTTICEPKGDERRITAYRWHIDDPVPFKKSLKVEIERRSFINVTDPATGKRISYDFKYRPDYWSSVAFWYQKGIAEPLWEFASVEERVMPEVWIEPTWTVEKARTSPGMKPERRSNRTCNLKQFFYMRNDKVGSWVEFPLTIAERGRYAASVFANLYKHHGVWKITLRGPDGETILDPGLDFWDDRVPRNEDWPENFEHGTTTEIKLGVHHIEPGDYRLRFECVGANPLTRHPETGEFSQGMSIGLDAICFRRLPIEDPYQWMQDYLANEKALFAEFDKHATDTVAALAKAIETFRQEEGKYPQTLDELVGTKFWSPERIPLDPWHQHYRYRAPGVVRPWAFDVWSVHGASRDPDEWIGNWNSPLRLANEAAGTVFEGESLKVVRATDGVSTSRQRLSSYGNAPISGRSQLFIGLKKAGDWAEIELPASVPAGRYRVYLFAATSWDYGICQWSLAGTPLGEPFDAQTPTLAMKALPPAIVQLTTKPNVLRVEATGKSEYSTSYCAGLDAIVLVPVP